MALLRVLQGRRRLLRFLAVGFATTIAGCMILDQVGGPRKRDFAFSHKLHVEDQGLDCDLCHTHAADADDPGMPTLDACMLCHEDMDADKPPERRVASLFEGEQFKAAKVFALGTEDVKFPHLKHASSLECATCHQGIEENEDVMTMTPLTMDGCIECHASKGASTECSTCHDHLGPDQPPPTHRLDWLQVHGQVARSGSEELANRCSLCHTETGCTTCHQTTPPKSHEAEFWRRRGHVSLARLDRASCTTCHRNDFCNRCHQDVLPISHRGSWGGVRETHCLTCHFPLRQEGCFACHKETPGHAQATPLPPSHNPGMNCRQCHGANVPLPHVDKGDNCVDCHR